MKWKDGEHYHQITYTGGSIPRNYTRGQGHRGRIHNKKSTTLSEKKIKKKSERESKYERRWSETENETVNACGQGSRCVNYDNDSQDFQRLNIFQIWIDFLLTACSNYIEFGFFCFGFMSGTSYVNRCWTSRIIPGCTWRMVSRRRKGIQCWKITEKFKQKSRKKSKIQKK